MRVGAGLYDVDVSDQRDDAPPVADDPKSIRGALGDELRKYRLRMGWGQGRASERLRYARTTLSKWELGLATPGSEALKAIARTYELSAAEHESARTLAAIHRVQAREAGREQVRQLTLDERLDRRPVVAVPTPPLPLRPANGVFISYRRSDDPGFAGRLYDRLEAKLGRSRVFMDVDSIELGVDFVDELDKALARCTALIAVIGPRWLTAMDPFGQRRLHDPDDFVRLEIERALDRNVRVIPILVDGAPMPRRQDLPDSLARLVRRNGHTMTHARFGTDSIELIGTLERILADGC